MTISVDRPAAVGAGRAPRAALDNARAASNSSSHMASLQLLVDIAARMPLEPLPVVDNVPAHHHQHQSVRLPPLHDILADLSDLPTARKRSWSEAMAAPERREQDGRRSASPGAEPSPRVWPLSAKITKQKRPIPVWPAHASELCRGVNDCWNSFQRAHKGRSVSTAEWKAARAQLWAEYDALQSEDERPRGMHQA